jgi:hypothetical protein
MPSMSRGRNRKRVTMTTALSTPMITFEAAIFTALQGLASPIIIG